MEETGNSMKKVPLRETNVIQDYLDGMAIKDLAEKYDRSHQSIGQFLRRQGIETEKRIQTKSPYHFNEHWLDELDCQEKIYWIGFFAADGYNDVPENRVRIKLQREDKYILEKFNELLQSDREVYDSDYFNKSYGKIEYVSELYLTSAYFCKRLEELKLPDNKSTILEFPDYIPDKWLHHYIRGYFDGDGSISIKENVNGTYKAEVTFVGSHNFIPVLDKILKEKLEIETNCYPKTNHEALKIQKQKDIKKLLDWLYQDSVIHLTRKYEKYIIFINSRDFSKMTLKEKSQKVKADSKDIIKRYLNGESASIIAKNYDCSPNVILRLLKSNNIEIRKNTTPQQRALKAKQENK